MFKKEWFEKETEYESRWRSGRIPTNIWKYIPGKHRTGVMNAFADSEGYWIWLNDGYRAYDHAEDCGIIHEYTIEDLRAAIKTITMISEPL